jgi:hypothetical protein
MLSFSIGFAIFVGLIPLALQFKVSVWISSYFFLTNALAGFVAGLGLWAVFGSVRLGDAISKANLKVFLLAPFQTPIVRRLSGLMWSYSILFTFEVVLFSLLLALAATMLNTRATPILGKFTSLDVAGALSFFF